MLSDVGVGKVSFYTEFRYHLEIYFFRCVFISERTIIKCAFTKVCRDFFFILLLRFHNVSNFEVKKFCYFILASIINTHLYYNAKCTLLLTILDLNIFKIARIPQIYRSLVANTNAPLSLSLRKFMN